MSQKKEKINPSLIYSVNEKVPASQLILLGAQHIFVNAAGWLVLASVFTTIGINNSDVENILRMGMIACGIGAILQSLKTKWIGSGYLCPPIASPTYASASILAGSTGGLSTIFGMTIISGICEILFSRFLPKLKSLFPPEVVGVVMTMIGIALVPIGFERLFEDSFKFNLSYLNHRESGIFLFILTLAAIYSCSIWGKGKIKLFPAFIAIGISWFVVILTESVSNITINRISDSDWISIPKFFNYDYNFELTLLIPFLIVAIASGLKTIGDITVCQKINDNNWKSPNIKSISKGVTATGITTLISGLLGTMGHSTSSANVGLSLASSATSRYIGISFGVLLITLSFFPKIAAIIVLTPAPIASAIMIFAASFMIVSGIQIITSRLLDTRRIIIVGTSISLGLSISLMPESYKTSSDFFQPILSSPVAFTSVITILLNLILSEKISNKYTIKSNTNILDYYKIKKELESFGSKVCADKSLIDRSIYLLSDAVDAIKINNGSTIDIELIIAINDKTLDVDISYTGKPILLHYEPIEADEVLLDKEGLIRLSGYLLIKRIKNITLSNENDKSNIHFYIQN